MDKLRVLVVDDEMGMQTGVERVLRDYTVRVPEVDCQVGFAVEAVATGAEALESIARAKPDILLLDHRLPDGLGMDILERVGAREDGEMLVIMITAYASIELALSAAKRGAYDFLAKPFTPEELTGTIRKAAARIMLQRQARRLSDERRQVRFQFISVLAHELKAPLSAVEGYLRLITDRTAGEDLAAYDKMVRRSLIRLEGMRKLIFDLLDMTRIESGQKARRLEKVDVCEVAREAIETLSVEAADRQITISLRPDAPLPMTADRDEIGIVLGNLLSNAVKYNRDGGRVDAVLGREGEVVSIAVCDTGIGMTPEEAAQLFTEFARIRNADTRHILGSGLGLSTVKKIAALYGGEASVESRPGEGSTFTVTLRDEA